MLGFGMEPNSSSNFTEDSLDDNDTSYLGTKPPLSGNGTLCLTTTVLPARQEQGFVLAFMVVGILTNTWSLAIFCRKNMRKFSMVWYLIGNALFNILYLSSLAMIWFGLESLGLLNYAPLYYLFVWLSHSSASLSTWYMATVAGDNCMRLCWPTLIPDYCTRTRAKEVSVSLFTTTSVVYAITLWSSEPIESADGHQSKWHRTFSKADHLLAFVDILMRFLLPCVVLVPASVRLVCQLAKSPPNRSTDLPTNMILALMTSSIVFLVLVFPGECLKLYLIIRSLADHSTVEEPYTYVGLRNVLKQLYFTSFSLGFFIFLGIWRFFRRELYEMACAAAGTSETNDEDNFIVIEMEDEYLTSVRSGNRRRVAYRQASV